jgi:1,4-alpha-glucan branching enzyme
MIETRVDGRGNVRATFRLGYGVGGHEVCLLGEFNDWSSTADPMYCEGHDYVTELVVASGRAYRFRYLIDGDRWQNDWAADSYAPNEFGGDDSVRR